MTASAAGRTGYDTLTFPVNARADRGARRALDGINDAETRPNAAFPHAGNGQEARR